jgi:nitrogen fixation protein FixH
MNNSAPPYRALKGAWPLWILAAFFAVIFSANGVLVYLANSSWTGLHTEDAYEKGRLYNNAIEAGARQRKLDWQSAASLEGRRLDFSLMDRDGEAIRGAVVRVRFVRPTHEGFDFTLALREDQRGHYFANTDFPLPGLWQADFHVVRGTADYRLKQRFTVK